MRKRKREKERDGETERERQTDRVQIGLFIGTNMGTTKLDFVRKKINTNTIMNCDSISTVIVVKSGLRVVVEPKNNLPMIISFSFVVSQNSYTFINNSFNENLLSFCAVNSKNTKQLIII